MNHSRTNEYVYVLVRKNKTFLKITLYISQKQMKINKQTKIIVKWFKTKVRLSYILLALIKMTSYIIYIKLIRIEAIASLSNIY